MGKGFSGSWWANYCTLLAKRDEGSIAPNEMRELTAQIDTLEEVNVHRMTCFACVSKLMGTSLDELMLKAHLGPEMA